jgi:hypothetical protein
MLDKLSLKDLKKFIINWNNQFPIDRWFRQKYNISFGSDEHRKVNLLEMLIEYEEDSLFRVLPAKLRQQEEHYKDYLETNIFLKKQSTVQDVYTDEEVDTLFNSIDLKELNKNVK